MPSNKAFVQDCVLPTTSLSDLVEDADDSLFNSILYNNEYVVNRILPSKTESTYQLRPKRHNRSLWAYLEPFPLLFERWNAVPARRGPHLGSLQRSSRPPAGFQAVASRQGKGDEKRGEERSVAEGKRKGEGEREGRGGSVRPSFYNLNTGYHYITLWNLYVQKLM